MEPAISATRARVARALLLCGLLGLLLVFHVSTHIASALGRLTGHRAWIDAVHVGTALGELFWVPPALLALGIAVRNSFTTVPAERPALGRRDVLIAVLIALAALSLRATPLIAEPWLKPDYDEGVYLGGAWLLRGGALPYRDWVFAHLPGSLLMLLPAANMIQPVHDNSLALLLARLTAALADALAAGLVFLAARQLAAVPGALLAGLVYVFDSRAVEYSRQVLLEPLQAPWLAGGAALLLALLNQPRHRRSLAVAAGFVLSLGVSVKLSGAVVPLAALGVLALERRWRSLRWVAAGVLLGALASCGWSLATSGDEIVRQTVLLQAGRATVQVFDHWAWLMGDYTTGFTAFAALLGVLALALAAWRRRSAPGWIFVLLWLALTYLLIAQAPVFYVHYYDTLLLPAALLAAAAPGLFRGRRALLAPAGVVAAALLWGQASQWPVVDRAPTWRPVVARVVAQADARPLLTLEPILNVLAGRPVARSPDGPYLLDMVLGEPYLDSPLNRRWPNAEQVRAETLAAADAALLAATDMGRFPAIERDFACQPAAPYSTLHLCRRYGRIATFGTRSALELLEVVETRVAIEGEQRWLLEQLRWRARATPPSDMALALHLLDATGRRVAQLDVPLNGGMEWRPWITVIQYRMPLPADLAPGRYRLALTVYSWTDGTLFPLTPAGGVATTTIDLPPVDVP